MCSCRCESLAVCISTTVIAAEPLLGLCMQTGTDQLPRLLQMAADAMAAGEAAQTTAVRCQQQVMEMIGRHGTAERRLDTLWQLKVSVNCCTFITCISHSTIHLTVCCLSPVLKKHMQQYPHALLCQFGHAMPCPAETQLSNTDLHLKAHDKAHDLLECACGVKDNVIISAGALS